MKLSTFILFFLCFVLYNELFIQACSNTTCHGWINHLIRARKYGWQDTYVFTKAMGEMVIDNMRGDIPVVIIRPSVIESTCKEPFPGWMEGNRCI